MKKLSILSILFLLTTSIIFPGNFEKLETLSYENTLLKSLRGDVRKSIFVIKSRREEKELPELVFYKYRIKKSDNFWKILSRTSLNIDTIMTINNFENQSDINSGMEIYLSNMRGILYRVKKNDTLLEIAKRYEVPYKYILSVNKMEKLDKEFIFIPCANVGKVQKSEFINGGFGRPLQRLIKTSSYGSRKDPFNARLKFHTGIDYRCSVGTPVYSIKSGKVIYTGFRGNYGKLVIVQHNKSLKSYYGHLSRIKVKKGDIIKKGQLIALSGNTGRSTGPHLHFEIRKDNKPVNPKYYLK